jgi:hypothetical protein
VRRGGAAVLADGTMLHVWSALRKWFVAHVR